MSLIEDSKNLRIPFQDIKEATQNFTTLIGRGGYGPVYRGRLLSLSGELTNVAVKRLQADYGQGIKEFLTEIQLLSRYKHQNLVSLVGFCEEHNEKFLVYVFAEHGSLDNYLKPTKTKSPLTWMQRINICIDAARGLDHLHNHVAKNQRVIHRDIKSANILLDHNWKAMIADFGLCKIGRANENDTYLITNASGTHGYCDPAYIRTGILTKESDVYSFGVVLFEVLCGRLCFVNVNSEERFLASLAQRYFMEGKLNLIIDRDLKNYTNSDSIKVFSEIAFQCLNEDRKRRPSIGLVLRKLQEALKLLEMEEAPELLELEEAMELKKLVVTLQIQQFEEAREVRELEEALGLHKLVKTLQVQQFEEAREMQELEEALGLRNLVEALQQHEFEETLKLQEAWKLQKFVGALKLEIGESRIDYEVMKAIYDLPDTPLSDVAGDQFYSQLSRGILVDNNNVWISINGDGKTQEMISAIKFVSLDRDRCTIRHEPNSRFPKVVKVLLPNQEMQVKIRTQFLSSDVSYAAYLVCKPDSYPGSEDNPAYSLIYTLNNKSKSYISYPSKMEDGGWWMFELFQTVNFKRIVDFEVTFLRLDRPFGSRSYLLFEGIHFLPIQKGMNEIEKSEVKNLSAIANREWNNLLPIDYKQFLYYSNKNMMNTPQTDVIIPTKEEAYYILSKGVLIKFNYDVNMWFWITKSNGKKCFMIPPTLLSYNQQPVKINRISSKESRIENVLHLSPSKVVGMRFEVPTNLFSTNTTYGCYLVYKLPQHFAGESMVTMKLDDGRGLLGRRLDNLITYLSIPQSPVIGPHGVSRSSRPINKHNSIQLPQKRKDDWLELNLGTKSDVQWMNIQQDEQYHHFWRRESTWKSCFLPCVSNSESTNIYSKGKNISFTIDPRCISTITIYMWPLCNPIETPELIVQGIEFRPV